jgi:hypothetical protein
MRENLALDYTPQWIALGIISAAGIANDECELLRGDNPHPEHYRWRAFSRFLAAQPSLSAALARDLYALGETDADRSMEASMQGAILRHADCPADLLRSALTAKEEHLRRIAARRLGPNRADG